MNNNSALVSIILPIYNSEMFLRDSIYSIINQTYTNIEIVVIDDSDNNKSFQIIERIEDKRIIYFKGNRAGLAKALNLGINKSNGKYIARMDSDDVSEFNRIEEQVRFLESTNSDICGCNVLIINENGETTDSFVSPKINEIFPAYLVSYVPFYHGSILIKKDFLTKNNIKYSSKYLAEDKILYIDFYNFGAKFGNVDKFLYKYRILKNSLFNKKYKLLVKELKQTNLLFIKKNIKKIKEDFFFNIKLYPSFSEKDKEILVKFYLNCFFKTFNPFFLKIFKIGKKRYLLIYSLKYLFNFFLLK